MDFVSKAIPKIIKFSSRASVKIGDNYFTVEYSEERMIPQVEEIQSTDIQGNKTSKIIVADIEKERADLWDTVNSECDNQIDIIQDYFKKSKK